LALGQKYEWLENMEGFEGEENFGSNVIKLFLWDRVLKVGS
jgi:hypothetical protein